MAYLIIGTRDLTFPMRNTPISKRRYSAVSEKPLFDRRGDRPARCRGSVSKKWSPGDSSWKLEQFSDATYCPIYATSELALEKLIVFIKQILSAQILDSVRVHCCNVKVFAFKQIFENTNLMSVGVICVEYEPKVSAENSFNVIRIFSSHFQLGCIPLFTDCCPKILATLTQYSLKWTSKNHSVCSFETRSQKGGRWIPCISHFGVLLLR